jgi:hypothetical protein
MQQCWNLQKRLRNLTATKKNGTELSRQRFYVLMTQRRWRRSVEAFEKWEVSGRTLGCRR